MLDTAVPSRIHSSTLHSGYSASSTEATARSTWPLSDSLTMPAV
jgi:hypothetical protein